MDDLGTLNPPLPSRIAPRANPFEHDTPEATVASDGGHIGGDSLSFALGADGTVSIAAAGLEFSVNESRNLLAD